MKIQFSLLILSLFLVYSCSDDSTSELQSTLQTNQSFEKPVNDLAKNFTKEEIAEFELEDLDQIESMLKTPSKTDRHKSVITVPADSQDAIQEAVDQAGSGGTVIIETGMHIESTTVTLTDGINLIGEDGATVVFDVVPIESAGFVQPAFHVYKATGATIRNLNIVAANDPGGTGILVEKSPIALIADNTISGFQMGVIVENKRRAYILRNTIETSQAWTTGAIFDAYGITIINGKNSRVVGNECVNGLFGIWACGTKGLLYGNSTSGNFIGHILCKVPDQAFELPSGDVVGSLTPATNWMVRHNESSGNFDAGYLVIDGANRNHLSYNTAGNNGTYDIELTDDTERFGFLTPKSVRNSVFAMDGQTVKNCGYLNYVSGGELVDNNVDPCM